MNGEERRKFNLYWQTTFKYLFFVFFIIVTARIIILFSVGRDEMMTLGTIATGYLIIAIGSFGLSILLAYIAVQKEK